MNNIKLDDYTFSTPGIRKKLFMVLILAILVAVFGICNAAGLKLLIDIAAGDSEVTILYGALLALVVIILQSLWEALYRIFRERVQNEIAAKSKTDLLLHIEKVPQEKLLGYHSGDLLTRLSDDADICAGVLPNIGASLFVGAVSCILSLGYAFYLSWKLAVLCILLSPLAVLWSRWLMPQIRRYTNLARTKESEIRAFSQEELSYISVIKSFSAYGLSKNRFQQKFSELASARVKQKTMNAILAGGANVAGFLSFIGTTALGGYLALQGEITVGTIIGFIQVLNYIVWPFTELMPLISNLQEGKAARERLREIEELPCEDEEKKVVFSGGDISLKLSNVSFSFGDREILKNVSFDLKSGQLVGIIGPSGCGKTTLIQLLLALYKPLKGNIYLNDGRNFAGGVSIRPHIAYVPQDHMLITGTIAENIAYGKKDFEIEKVIEAAKKAGIHDFILSLPEQYRTEVHEKGGNFSFGQAQRIAIARALYKDAPVLVLDEPTASLDADSRQIILNTLKKESENRLCIMVCHDQIENRELFDVIAEFCPDGEVTLIG